LILPLHNSNSKSSLYLSEAPIILIAVDRHIQISSTKEVQVKWTKALDALNSEYDLVKSLADELTSLKQYQPGDKPPRKSSRASARRANTKDGDDKENLLGNDQDAPDGEEPEPDP
jgi:hypothetical protein